MNKNTQSRLSIIGLAFFMTLCMSYQNEALGFRNMPLDTEIDPLRDIHITDKIDNTNTATATEYEKEGDEIVADSEESTNETDAPATEVEADQTDDQSSENE